MGATGPIIAALGLQGISSVYGAKTQGDANSANLASAQQHQDLMQSYVKNMMQQGGNPYSQALMNFVGQSVPVNSYSFGVPQGAQSQGQVTNVTNPTNGGPGQPPGSNYPAGVYDNPSVSSAGGSQLPAGWTNGSGDAWGSTFYNGARNQGKIADPKSPTGYSWQLDNGQTIPWTADTEKTLLSSANGVFASQYSNGQQPSNQAWWLNQANPGTNQAMIDSIRASGGVFADDKPTISKAGSNSPFTPGSTISSGYTYDPSMLQGMLQSNGQPMTPAEYAQLSGGQQMPSNFGTNSINTGQGGIPQIGIDPTTGQPIPGSNPNPSHPSTGITTGDQNLPHFPVPNDGPAPDAPYYGPGNQPGSGGQQQGGMYRYTAPTTGFGYTPNTLGDAPMVSATGTQGFNAGQDALMQMMTKNLTPGANPDLDLNLQQLGSGNTQYNTSDLFGAIDQSANKNLNDQVAQLHGSAGSLGQRFGTAMMANEGRVRQNAVTDLNLQKQQIGMSSFEAAQGRRQPALNAMISNQGQNAGIAQALAGLGLQQGAQQLSANQGNQNILSQFMTNNANIKNQAGQFNAQMGQNQDQFNASQGNIYNNLIMQAISQAGGMQQGSQSYNAGLLGILNGVGVPQQQASPWANVPGDIGNLAMLYPFLNQLTTPNRTGSTSTGSNSTYPYE